MVQWISARAPRRVGYGSRVWSAVGALFRRPEPVEMLDQRFNFLPRSFRWRGDVWRVRSIARVWDRPSTALLPPRRYFEVNCGQRDSYILVQDLRIDVWYLSL